MKKIFNKIMIFIYLFIPSVSFGAKSSGSSTGKISNPINVSSISDLIDTVLETVIAVGAPIAVFFMIYAGFKYVIARGNKDKIKEAHQMLLWVIVGTVILLGASLLSDIVSGTIDQLKEGL